MILQEKEIHCGTLMIRSTVTPILCSRLLRFSFVSKKVEFTDNLATFLRLNEGHAAFRCRIRLRNGDSFSTDRRRDSILRKSPRRYEPFRRFDGL